MNRMSDDLISREEALQVLEDVFGEYRMSWGREHGGFGAAAQEVIEELPTAFDKEKVIEELRSEASRWHESGVEFKDENEKGVAAGFRLATHIVEKGGIE